MGAKYRLYDPEQVYFTVIDPDNMKSHNPLLGAIHSFIEEHVSIEPFSERVRNELGGAPAVHPKLMLKIIFYSYAKGVYSSREIEDRLRWDPNYVYLSSNQKVDHSTICNFILQYEEEVKDIFSKLVYVMAKMGYVKLDFVAIDGTKIRANAGKRFTGDIKEFRKKRKKIEKKIDKILHHTLNEGLSEKYRVREFNKLDVLKREREKIDAFLEEVSNEEPTGKISLTDRDARMVKDQDTKYVGYNCQSAVDAEAGVIVGAEVFNEASDTGLLRPMIEETKNGTGSNLEGVELGFDAGYFSSKNLQYCEDSKLNVYLPEGRGESGKKKRKKSDTIESRDCELEIDGEIRRLTCPGGQVMERRERKKWCKRAFYVFHPKREYCESCAFRDRCYRNVRKYKKFSVKKEYFDTLPLRKRMMEKLSSQEGKCRMNDRACVIEHVFGEIKELFKFRRFVRIRLPKVKLIWRIVCIAYNLRKLARLAYGY